MTKVLIGRRAVLSGLLGGAASVALADPVVSSLRPRARSGSSPVEVSRIAPHLRANAQDMIDASGLGGVVGFVIADAESGVPIEAINADHALPPASVTKSLTTLYTLNALGEDYRFVTRLLATTPVVDGVLDGDLILVGGGDPSLSTDHMADLAQTLKKTGLTDVRGRFLCWGGALPYAEEIEPGQLDYLGYNPAVSGLNLNYNRVHFEWARTGGNYRVTMDARTETYRPDVHMAQVRISSRDVPVFNYEGADEWTVARGALGNGGSRWLPVRRPALYAGDVFRTMAAAEGLPLPEPHEVSDLPEGTEIARHESASLRTILKDMLLYSTNLTAEICGLSATQAVWGDSQPIGESAAKMTAWLNDRYGVSVDFKDHSGLSDQNRISAGDMVKILLAEGPDGPLKPLLKEIGMRDDEGNHIDDYPVNVHAKTGTLNFVSTLAGYVETSEGADLAFAIFAGDIERREVAKAVGDEIPAGSISYNSHAKQLQQDLLQRWGLSSRQPLPSQQLETGVSPGGIAIPADWSGQ